MTRARRTSGEKQSMRICVLCAELMTKNGYRLRRLGDEAYDECRMCRRIRWSAPYEVSYE